MNVEELKKAIRKNVPKKEFDKVTKVVVAKKKNRGGYQVYPCVVDITMTHIPLPGFGDCMAIVFED